MDEENHMKKGKVYLIGAGPGDPELLTLKGRRCLAEADVVVGDYLADARILKYARPGSEYIYVGKSAGNHTMKQSEISALLAQKGAEGKIVARLKGGDPFVFGRGGEEIEVLRSHGIPFEEVPGVTSAIAAPAYAGIPVTHRGVAASFAVVTGHEDPTKAASSIHWDKLAGGVDTLIFLMGVGHTAMIASRLMEHGRAPTTPAAFVRWGTRPYQETYTTTLAHAAQDVERLGIRPPAVFVVGDVVRLRETMNWFDNRPLFGKRIVVTRSRSQASKLVQILDAKGAMCHEIPTIAIAAPSDDFAGLDLGIAQIESYDWLVLTSQNGVQCFFDRLFAKGKDVRALGKAKVACIGPVTAKALQAYGLRADCVPSDYKAEDLLAEMKKSLKPGEKIFIPRAKEARGILPEGLRAAGAFVDVAEAYRTEADTAHRAALLDLLEKREVDIITFTSSSTVRNLMTLIRGKETLLSGVTLACIGPITADTCREYGFAPAIISDVYTIDGLVEAIETYCHGGNQ